MVRRRRPALRRRRAVRRKMMNQPEKASCSETLVLPVGTTNAVYGPNPLDLATCKRASTIASQYQQYRITGITWRFRPHFDTFVATSDAATSYRVPQFFYLVDKALTVPTAGVTFDTLRQCGSKPIRFDDKIVKVSYRPGVTLNATSDTPVTGANAQLKTCPWLSTGLSDLQATWAPSQVFHNGLWFGLEVDLGIPGDGDYQYGVEVELQFEFRKPLALVTPGVTNKSIRDVVAA